MVGGGIFDNMWDPYSGSFAYPRSQPRPRYYRPRAPVRDHVYDHYSPVTEPVTTAKNVKSIPVTDGNAPPEKVPEKVSIAPVVVTRFRSDSDAATKIQAVYRGYVVRKTQPLQHLRVIKKVKEELESLKGKFGEREQKEKLGRDPQERVRWVEGVMALLLRLDSLQGVHPDVRIVRKSVAKEVIGFQETIDSMSSELIGDEDVDDGEKVDGSNAAEVIENAGDSTYVEEMEIEGPCASEEVSGGERECANGSEAVEDSSISEKYVHQAPSDAHDQVTDSVAAPHCLDQSGSLPGLVGESIMIEAGLVSEPNAISTDRDGPSDAEVPMEVESKEQMGRVQSEQRMEECELEEPASSQNRAQISPPLDVRINNQEASRGDHSAETALAREDIPEPISENDASVGPVEDNSEAMMPDQAHEMVIPQCGANGDTEDNPNVSAHPEEKETAPEISDGCIIPVSNSMATDLQRDKSLQGDLNPKLAADKTTDRELLLQLLEENRKLRDVVGKVLQWGKQQSDAIQSLTNRIAQLEEQEHPPKLLQGGDSVNGRKRITNCVCPGESMGRSRRRLDKGRKNRRHLGYVDSEDWLESAESDEFF